MKDFLTKILTGPDNTTFDISKVSMFIAIVVFNFLEIAKFFLLHRFSEVEYAGGMGAISCLGSGAIYLKRKAEPKDGAIDKNKPYV